MQKKETGIVRKTNYFVEGLQGAGKSTFVRLLSEQLKDYQVFHEGDYSPVELAWCAWATKGQCSNFQNVPRSRVQKIPCPDFRYIFHIFIKIRNLCQYLCVTDNLMPWKTQWRNWKRRPPESLEAMRRTELPNGWRNMFYFRYIFHIFIKIRNLCQYLCVTDNPAISLHGCFFPDFFRQ